MVACGVGITGVHLVNGCVHTPAGDAEERFNVEVQNCETLRTSKR
jgi:hypothetical protein